MSNEKSLLCCAHDYADRNIWTIIPVRGKKAACKWRRYTKVCPTLKQRGGLFSGKNITGLAVIPGEVSNGLRVRDFDQADAYTRWAETYPDLASRLPTVRTRRGFHVYFRADLPETVTKFDDGELRAGKCIVVLPPSPHPEGGRYEWLVEPADEIPFLPDVAETGLFGPAPTAPTISPVPPEVVEAIAKTLPTGPGQRHNLTFKFARRLKGITGLDTSPAALDSYIQEWHRQAQPYIRTKKFETTEIAFYDSWQNSLVPLTDEVFWGLVKHARTQPEPEWFKDWFFPRTGKMLLLVCMALAEHAGDEPFFLAAWMAGVTIGVAPKDANELLKRLVKGGFLQLVEKGKFENGRASTWRYVGPRAYDSSGPSEEKLCAWRSSVIVGFGGSR